MILLIFFSIILVIESFCYFKLKSSNKTKFDYYRDIPSNENPAIIGLMVKGNVDGNDIMATILDLWKKGYIDVQYRYVNNEEKCILLDNEKDRFLTLKDYENYLLDELFKDSKEIVFDDFISSPKFEIIFKNVGNMIQKRVDIKSFHKISKKKIFNKINFLVNYMVLGYSIFFSFLYLLTSNFAISIIFGYIINLIIFLLIKNVILNVNRIEHLVLGYSVALSVVYFGLLVIVYLLSNYIYEVNNYITILNMIISVVLLISMLLGNIKNILFHNFTDTLIFIFSIVSIIFNNIIGVCICIIYFSNRIYLLSPNHVNYSNSSELEKWQALKKFLNDFSVINERELMEVKIWDKYLIYAIAMGVNKKSIEKYIKLSNIKLINMNIINKYYVENIDY